MHSPYSRISRYVAAIMIFFALLPPASAAVVDLLVFPTPLGQLVREGQPAKVTFTIKNRNIEAVVLDSVGSFFYQPFGAPRNPPESDGDRCPEADCITGISQIGGSCGVGTILVISPCTIVLQVTTGDARIPDPDRDVGDWEVVLTGVFGHTIGFPHDEPVGMGMDAFSIVGVKDSPEPSTWTMLILGFAWLVFSQHRKSTKALLTRGVA